MFDSCPEFPMPRSSSLTGVTFPMLDGVPPTARRVAGVLATGRAVAVASRTG